MSERFVLRAIDPGELARARSQQLRRYGQDGTSIERLEDGSLEVTVVASTGVPSSLTVPSTTAPGMPTHSRTTSAP